MQTVLELKETQKTLLLSLASTTVFSRTSSSSRSGSAHSIGTSPSSISMSSTGSIRSGAVGTNEAACCQHYHFLMPKNIVCV
jgi:hypothetical protein